MRAYLFVFSLLLIQFSFGQQPLTADAGADSLFCLFLFEDSLQIGSSVPASGGTPPYQYRWDIAPNPFVGQVSNELFELEDLLNDTTLANPFLYPHLPASPDGPIPFILKVEDSLGAEARDTVLYYWSSWVVGLGNFIIESFPGDTQTISPGVFGGGFPPYTLDWGDSDSLLGDRYDYNVYPNQSYPTREVIIPAGLPLVFFTLTVIDSMGCALNVGSAEGFMLTAASIDPAFASGLEMNVFPTPTQDLLYVELDGEVIQAFHLLDIDGREQAIKANDFRGSERLQLNLEGLPNGPYLLIVETQMGAKSVMRVFKN